MKGDFTRDTFEPTRHYSRVLSQQGRVQLDADWNEQQAILLHYLRTLTRDIIGPYAGPVASCGFEIITAATLHRLEVSKSRFSFLEKQVKAGNFIIGPGRYYVDGILVENEQPLLYTEQRGYPFPNSPRLEELDAAAPFLIYLDVWERHITAVEDDHLREVALNGPDTCTRTQVVWAAKVLPGSAVQGQRLTCSAVDTLPNMGTGELRARARLDMPPELCAIPPSSRFRGAENQLYRVEIHVGGNAKTPATFKWSRENGSVTFPIRQLANNSATLVHLGRDSHLTLAPGDWVEASDDRIALSGQPGLLAEVKEVFRDDLRVTLTPPGSPPVSLPSYGPSDAGVHPLLRRWDHKGDTDLGGALLVAETADPPGGSGGWLDLEDGVQVWFAAGGAYLSGDYWLVPARVATGDVEWPHEVDEKGAVVVDGDGNPLAAKSKAAGLYHHFAPLWLSSASYESKQMVGSDCRCQIASLPCATYGYAYGAAAIGPQLITRGPRRAQERMKAVRR